MPHTYTKNKRIKRPDFRPNGKRRLKAQQAEVEKDRLARVAANELKGKLFAPLKHDKLPPPPSEDALNKQGRAQGLRKPKQDPQSIRFRSLHKLLRQIVALEKKQNSGIELNEAQLEKLGRFDDVAVELEELQKRIEADARADKFSSTNALPIALTSFANVECFTASIIDSIRKDTVRHHVKSIYSTRHAIPRRRPNRCRHSTDIVDKWNVWNGRRNCHWNGRTPHLANLAEEVRR